MKKATNSDIEGRGFKIWHFCGKVIFEWSHINLTYRFSKSFLYTLDMFPFLNSLLDFVICSNKCFLLTRTCKFKLFIIELRKKLHISFIVCFCISEKYRHGANYFMLYLFFKHD